MIPFDATEEQSANQWKIIRKLSEHNNQSIAEIYQDDPRPTEAWVCCKVPVDGSQSLTVISSEPEASRARVITGR